MREALQAVAMTLVDDFFSFEIGESMAHLGLNREFTGYRFNVTSRIGSRVFDSFHVDCTAGDALIDPFDVITVGDSLTFAGVPTAEVNAIREGQHFAEKLHALCRPRTRQNSRVKDLFDIVLFVNQCVEPSAVARALPKVFELGDNLAIPMTLPVPPPEWQGPYDEMSRDNKLGHTFDEARRILARFYSYVLSILNLSQ
ncbi:MAG: nucleotidyl transferase AbiEii/AbiGii toxin family protein [Pseudomonadota bacterium]